MILKGGDIIPLIIYPNSLMTKSKPDSQANGQEQSLFSQLLNTPPPQADSTSDPSLMEGTQKFEAPPTDKLTPEECEQVIDRYAQHYKLTVQQAAHSISYWCQMGGYVKSVPNRKFNINRVCDEELDTLRNIVKLVRPNGTVRQLARALAKIIVKYASHYDYYGHLAKNLKTFRPGLEGNNLIYACEFYFGLDFTPNLINEALAERAKSRKNPRTATGNRKGQGGNKRKK
jgi:hypothetical protein